MRSVTVFMSVNERDEGREEGVHAFRWGGGVPFLVGGMVVLATSSPGVSSRVLEGWVAIILQA